MRPFVNMRDASLCGNVTSTHDDVTPYNYLTSSRFQPDILTLEKFGILKFESPYNIRNGLKRNNSMENIGKKLTDLEKRTTALQIVYDSLLNRAKELESRASICEREYNQKKTSFDIIEFLMKQDGRAKAMFDHVALFFYVLLSKLRRKGIEIYSTTELWNRLADERVKAAFENTVTNLGFSESEMHSLNVILDGLHKRDLTTNVNHDQVDSNNLSAKLKDLGSEFTVKNPETDDESEPEVNGSQSVGPGCSASSRQTINAQTSESANYQFTRNDRSAACGDTYGVDSLLLYLQIHDDLDPLVRSTLRRAVAIAHCSVIKRPEIVEADLTLQDLDLDDNHDDGEYIITPTCINNIENKILTEQNVEMSIPSPQQLQSHCLHEIECDDDFMDLVTSTPKPNKTPRSQEVNISNNAQMVDSVSLLPHCIFDGIGLPTTNKQPVSNLDDSKLNRVAEVDGKNDNSYTLSRIESMLTSQGSISPEKGLERSKKFRSFYQKRLKRKTNELVKAEWDSIKSRLSPQVERKSKLNLDCAPCSNTKPTLSKFVCEIYEVDRAHEFDGYSDSESSSFLSSVYLNSDTGSSYYTEDDRSISLHEELSEVGFFTCGTPKEGECDHVSQSGSETKKTKHHMNFFNSPVNPYGYDFDADYYMLWPGQEMEIELKDLSCDIKLDHEDDKTSEFVSSWDVINCEQYSSWVII